MELTTVFKQIVDKYSEDTKSLVCEVISVDKDAKTCDVQPLNGEPEVFDVMLQAGESSDKGVLLLPKEKSQVIVSFISDEVAYVAMTSEVDKVVIENNSESLKSILEDLISAIEQLTVPTGVGPSGVPINLASFTQVKQRISNLLD